jgi:hypothetical protein
MVAEQTAIFARRSLARRQFDPAGGQRRWYGENERFGGLEIDN